MRELLHRKARGGVRDRRDRQRDQYLIRMQTRVDGAEMIHLELLDRLDDRRVDQIDSLGDVAQVLHSVEQHRGACAEQLGRLAGDDGAVLELDRGGGIACSGFPV